MKYYLIMQISNDQANFQKSEISIENFNMNEVT